MSKYLIAGGAGYIGSHMIYSLLQQGNECIVIDNYLNSNNKNLKALEEEFKTKIKVVEHDLKNPIKDLTDNFDAVFHFAALKAVGESVAKPLDYYRNNLNSIINLLEFCKERSINNFIFSSTAAVYGNSGKSKVSEDDPVNPENPYGWSKLMSEQIIKDANKSYGINAVILRYFNVAGNVKDAIIGDLQPNPQNLIPAMIMSHLGLRPINLKVFGNDYPTRDGTGVRDYIHVLDLVEGHLKALDYLQSNSGVNTFNLGTGNGATVLEVIKTFEEVTGEKLNYEIVERRPGDPAEVLTETEKSKNILNWEAKYSLREMVESMVKWYRRWK